MSRCPADHIMLADKRNCCFAGRMTFCQTRILVLDCVLLILISGPCCFLSIYPFICQKNYISIHLKQIEIIGLPDHSVILRTKGDFSNLLWKDFIFRAIRLGSDIFWTSLQNKMQWC
jgi:hypothetical protein